MKQLLNGDFGLKKAFWLYGVAVTFIINLFHQIIESQIDKKIGRYDFITYLQRYGNLMKLDSNFVILSVIYVSSFVFLVGYVIIAGVGIWRSASVYEGSGIWSFLAKLIILFGVPVILSSIL